MTSGLQDAFLATTCPCSPCACGQRHPIRPVSRETSAVSATTHTQSCCSAVSLCAVSHFKVLSADTLTFDRQAEARRYGGPAAVRQAASNARPAAPAARLAPPARPAPALTNYGGPGYGMFSKHGSPFGHTLQQDAAAAAANPQHHPILSRDELLKSLASPPAGPASPPSRQGSPGGRPASPPGQGAASPGQGVASTGQGGAPPARGASPPARGGSSGSSSSESFDVPILQPMVYSGPIPSPQQSGPKGPPRADPNPDLIAPTPQRRIPLHKLVKDASALSKQLNPPSPVGNKVARPGTPPAPLAKGLPSSSRSGAPPPIRQTSPIKDAKPQQSKRLGFKTPLSRVKDKISKAVRSGRNGGKPSPVRSALTKVKDGVKNAIGNRVEYQPGPAGPHVPAHRILSPGQSKLKGPSDTPRAATPIHRHMQPAMSSLKSSSPGRTEGKRVKIEKDVGHRERTAGGAPLVPLAGTKYRSVSGVTIDRTRNHPERTTGGRPHVKESAIKGPKGMTNKEFVPWRHPNWAKITPKAGDSAVKKAEKSTKAAEAARQRALKNEDHLARGPLTRLHDRLRAAKDKAIDKLAGKPSAKAGAAATGARTGGRGVSRHAGSKPPKVGSIKVSSILLWWFWTEI